MLSSLFQLTRNDPPPPYPYDEQTADEIVARIFGDHPNVEEAKTKAKEASNQLHDEGDLTDEDFVLLGESVNEYIKKNHPNIEKKIERAAANGSLENRLKKTTDDPDPDTDPDDSGIFSRLVDFVKWCWDKVALGAGIVGCVLSYLLGLSIPVCGLVGLGAYFITKMVRGRGVESHHKQY